MQTIEILEPAHGWKSGPLQKHHLPEHLPDPPEGEAVSSFQWNNLEVVAADRSMPLPIQLKWSRVGGRWSGISYEVCLSPAPDLTGDAVRITGISKPFVEFWHPYLGATYHWKVQAF
nr:hypothetical protein [Nitrospinaceae bacterium]